MTYKFNVDLNGRNASLNVEKRVYKGLKYQCASDACREATERAHTDGLHDVLIVRLTGYSARGSVVMPAETRR